MALTLEELVKRFGGEIAGDALGRGAAPLDQAGPQQLAFLANPKYLSQVESTRAGAVLIAPKDLEKLGAAASGRNFIVTPNPYAYFARVAQMFIDLATPQRAAGVHPSATIDPAAQVAASAVIGPRDGRGRCGDRGRRAARRERLHRPRHDDRRGTCIRTRRCTTAARSARARSSMRAP